MIQVYTTGGEVVTVSVSNLAPQGTLRSEISIRIDSLFLAPPSSVSFTPNAAGGVTLVKFSTPELNAGDRGISITHLPSSRAAFAMLTTLREPEGVAVLALSPSAGDNAGGATVVALLTNFKRLPPGVPVTVSFNSVDIAVESITSVQSSLDSTLVHLTLPAWPTGGSVTVRDK